MRKIGTGLAAGLLAGVVFGVALNLMQTPMPTGDQPSMMMAVAEAIGARWLVAAWSVHLAVSALLGIVFVALLGPRAGDPAAGVAAGLAFALVLWVVGGLIVVPLRAGGRPFDLLRSLDGVPIAIGSLLAHLLYGAALGVLVPWLSRRGQAVAARRPGA